mmetsp:Transcript_125386/g.177050  ORF Transcript_125386/g.177050 Transcript_125386/m.177050 type:complete len:218 (+) Transcript_125386:1397-2050(+)
MTALSKVLITLHLFPLVSTWPLVPLETSTRVSVPPSSMPRSRRTRGLPPTAPRRTQTVSSRRLLARCPATTTPFAMTLDLPPRWTTTQWPLSRSTLHLDSGSSPPSLSAISENSGLVISAWTALQDSTVTPRATTRAGSALRAPSSLALARSRAGLAFPATAQSSAPQALRSPSTSAMLTTSSTLSTTLTRRPPLPSTSRRPSSSLWCLRPSSWEPF